MACYDFRCSLISVVMVQDVSVGEIIKTQESCGICGDSEARILSHTGRHYQALTTVICTGCGMVHSEPIPSQAELQAYYKKQYRDDYKGAVRPKRKHVLRYSRGGLERLSRLLGFVATGKLLDVGSGSGEFVTLARLHGFEAEGLEPHEGYANYTGKHYEIPVVNAPLEKADIPAESYDVITLNHVLEHLRSPFEALSLLHSWLKPGGLIAVDVPDIEACNHSPTNRFHFAHIYNFNHATLAATLEKAGFTVEARPEYQGTILFARKTHASDAARKIPLPKNYARLWQLLSEDSTQKHYVKATPYKRFLSKAVHYPLEYLHALLLWNRRRIIQRQYQRMFGA